MTADARPRIDWVMLPLVIAGGAVGSLLRWALTAPSPTIWPLAAVNIGGSLALGAVVGILGSRRPRWRALLGTGLLGGFTSYSALTVFFVAYAGLFAGSAAWFGVVVLLGMIMLVVAGALAAWAGLALGERIARRGGAS
ncbi:CrcB family protein [Microbacterium sp. gxy059]|uniref:CrcB family protein n=1 Tax=Microbacterium sp. gxy059 TaxID=2957199 RepID=UPI003D963EF6